MFNVLQVHLLTNSTLNPAHLALKAQLIKLKGALHVHILAQQVNMKIKEPLVLIAQAVHILLKDPQGYLLASHALQEQKELLQEGPRVRNVPLELTLPQLHSAQPALWEHLVRMVWSVRHVLLELLEHEWELMNVLLAHQDLMLAPQLNAHIVQLEHLAKMAKNVKHVLLEVLH